MRRERGARGTARAESEARFRDLVEGLDAIIWEADVAARRFSFVSRRAEAVLGYPVQKWIDEPDFWANHLHPDDRSQVLDALRAYVGGHTPRFDSEHRLRHADGTYRWVQVRARWLGDADGKGRRMGGSLTDVTEIKRTEEHMAVLVEIAHDTSVALDLVEMLDRVHRHISVLLRCDRVATFYWDPERNSFRDVARHGLPDELIAEATALEFPPDHPIAVRLANGEMLVVDDLREQTWLPPELVRRFGLRSMVAAPLFVGGRPMGALVAFRTANGSAFDAREVELFRGIAHHVAIALGTADSYQAQREEAQVASALVRVAEEVISSLNQPVLLNRLCRVTSEVLECDFSHTFLWNAQGEVFAAAGYGDTPEQWESMRALRIPRALLPGLIAELERDEATQLVMSEPQDRLPAALSIKYGITVGMYVALRRGGELIGIHTAGFRGRTERFSPVHLRIGRGLSKIASLALANAQLIEETERANRLKSDFVATMSHELRTPLTAIMGYNDLLSDGAFGPVNSEQVDVLKRMDRSARQLLDLINTTLDLSRLEAGRVEIDRKSVALGDLLHEIADEAGDVQVKPAVSLEWDLPGEVPTIETDPLKLKIILKNLLANAFKFTDRGSVTVRVAKQDGGVEIDVADTGIGMTPETQSVIFEPFRQGDSSSTRRYSGVGLGLYITRRLLEILGGTISVESAPSHGSTFRIWIPRALPKGPSSSQAP